MKKCELCGTKYSEETENGLCPNCASWQEVTLCERCKSIIDCECMECHHCHPETICDTCGFCHIDMWEASACWSMENDPDYDPFDI